MFRRAAIASGGLLVLFHAWLLGSQVWDGQLLELGLALRWLVAAGLVAALAMLRRRGHSIVWGRKAVSIWLLAALLHGPAVADTGLQPDWAAVPEAVTTLVQVGAASVGIGLGLLLIGALLRRRHAPSVARATATASRRPGLRAAGRGLRFAPRPPPFRPLPALV